MMLREVAHSLPVGMLCVMMDKPGLPVEWVNEAFERLTLWGNECVGQNCRFLQGAHTEKPAVRMIVKAVRNGQPMPPIMLTNYRKDGTEFSNVLSLHPVHDTNGHYTYSLGVLISAEQLETSLAEVCEQVRSALPRSFDAALRMDPHPPTATIDQAAEDARRWNKQMAAFTRRLLRMDNGATLDYLIAQAMGGARALGIDMLKHYVMTELEEPASTGHALELDVLTAHAQLQREKGSKQAERRARDFYQSVYGEKVTGALALSKKLRKHADTARASLVDEVVGKFTRDKAYCEPLVQGMLGEASPNVPIDRAEWAVAARELMLSLIHI